MLAAHCFPAVPPPAQVSYSLLQKGQGGVSLLTMAQKTLGRAPSASALPAVPAVAPAHQFRCSQATEFLRAC